jgi:four helix bundle protein
VHVNERASGVGTRSMGRHEGSAVPRPENLDVYRCAIDFLALATRFGAALPRGEGELRDQLKRASMSIPLNIAESCGKTSALERARFLSIARGSALECGAILDVAVATGVLDPTPVGNAKMLLARIVAMLTKMTR